MAAPKRMPLKQFFEQQMGQPLQPHHRALIDMIEGVEAGKLVVPVDHFRAAAKSSLREVAARARKLREQS